MQYPVMHTLQLFGQHSPETKLYPLLHSKHALFFQMLHPIGQQVLANANT